MSRYQVRYRLDDGTIGLRLVKAFSAMHAMQLVQMIHNVLCIIDATKKGN